MNFTLHQLRVFLKVVENKSVTKAAEELFLTQPAVSIQLKRFQDQFEIPLTEVMGRQLHITDFGREVASVSKKILDEAEGLSLATAHYKGLLTGKIKISVVSTGKYVIPYFLRDFMKKYPSVEIIINVSNKQSVVKGLQKNDSDFYLVSVLPDGIPLEKVELLDNKLYMVGSSRFRDMKLTKKRLSELTLIFREEGSATRNAMSAYLEDQKIQGYKSMELVSNEAVKQAVNAGLGFSIMPLIGLRNELAMESLHIFSMKKLPIITRWHLVYPKGKQLLPASVELIRFIEENKQQVVENYFDWAMG
ncbi:MAG: LysR family transcriptional regulator [Bacteroidota bacterium]